MAWEKKRKKREKKCFFFSQKNRNSYNTFKEDKLWSSSGILPEIELYVNVLVDVQKAELINDSIQKSEQKKTHNCVSFSNFPIEVPMVLKSWEFFTILDNVGHP